MYNRKIFPILEAHLSKQEVTVITGMRRVGKSTTLRHLLEISPLANKLYLDLERPDHRLVFQQKLFGDVQRELEQLGIRFDQPGIVALDEIQLVPEITHFIKYYHDHSPIKFIVTGSSSFYLRNRFSESLAGRKRIFEMYPLDFFEFLHFKGVDASELSKYSMQPYSLPLYNRFKAWYEEFVRFGGFPQVVLAGTEEDKIVFLQDIINAYIELDIRLLSDFDASATLYRLIRLLAARSGTLLEVSGVTGVLGADRRKVGAYLELLERTYFIYLVAPFTKNTDKEIAYRKKVFLADTGILNQLAQVSSGQVFENAVFLQLLWSGIADIRYYQTKSGAEIDFVLDQKTAVEVKETPHSGDLVTLLNRSGTLGLPESRLIGRYPPGEDFRNFIWGGMVG
ncbi:MAG: ATP-binding protein [Saprospiraceae bacterium]|nr:ATP-binding protein [Saprospiraceae bacterium]